MKTGVDRFTCDENTRKPYVAYVFSAPLTSAPSPPFHQMYPVLFIFPHPKTQLHIRTHAQELEVDPDAEESEGLTRPPSQPQQAGDGKLKAEKDTTFWYSTGDTRSSNTKDDMDMELVSLDKFVGSVRRIFLFFLRDLSVVCPLPCFLHPFFQQAQSKAFFFVARSVFYPSVAGFPHHPFFGRVRRILFFIFVCVKSVYPLPCVSHLGFQPTL